jgi:putative oxygen-independent coproporphyrinogen III oxidase
MTAALERQLGIYLHWPYCDVICPYCDFNIYRARDIDHRPLLDAILADLRFWRDQTGARRLSSLFFGGGTPSLLPPSAVAEVIEACAALWGFCPDAEISLEANPTDAETSRFADLASAGVNRLSLGIQSFDDTHLKFLGRNHDGAAGRKAAAVALASFDSVSFDFIYALPDQSVAQWQDALADAITRYGPHHISPYQLTIELGTAFARAVARGAWAPVDQAAAADFFEATGQLLSNHGYGAYEVSNHARQLKARSAHNQLYWRSQDWIGVGPGAHGRLGAGVAREATVCASRPGDYIATVAGSGTGAVDRSLLGLDAAREEFWMMGLRLMDGVSMDDAPGAPLDAGALTRLMDGGFLQISDRQLALSRTGVPVADAVVRQLLV